MVGSSITWRYLTCLSSYINTLIYLVFWKRGLLYSMFYHWCMCCYGMRYHTCSPTQIQKQYTKLGLKYKFGCLWFGYCEPQNERWNLWSMYPAESKRTEQAIMIGVQCRASPANSPPLSKKLKLSLRGHKKNCRTLNQYRQSSSRGWQLKWGWPGQSDSKHPRSLLFSSNICSGICFQWTLMQLQVPGVFRNKR